MSPGEQTLGRRIKAAKELGGFESLDQLARAANLPNLSGKSLRRSANDERTPAEHELVKIAEVCGVPYEFFTVDFGRLAQINGQPVEGESSTPVDAVAEELRGVRELLRDQGLRLAALELADQQRRAEGESRERVAL